MLVDVSIEVVSNDALILLFLHGHEQTGVIVGQLSDLLLILVYLVVQQRDVLLLLAFFIDVLLDFLLEALHFLGLQRDHLLGLDDVDLHLADLFGVLLQSLCMVSQFLLLADEVKCQFFHKISSVGISFQLAL